MKDLQVHTSIKLKKNLDEIYSIPPNDLYFRPATKMYKILTGRLKKMPLLYILPMSFFISATLYLVFGQLVVKLVSLLQYGS